MRLQRAPYVVYALLPTRSRRIRPPNAPVGGVPVGTPFAPLSMGKRKQGASSGDPDSDEEYMNDGSDESDDSGSPEPAPRSKKPARPRGQAGRGAEQHADDEAGVAKHPYGTRGARRGVGAQEAKGVGADGSSGGEEGAQEGGGASAGAKFAEARWVPAGLLLCGGESDCQGCAAVATGGQHTAGACRCALRYAVPLYAQPQTLRRTAYVGADGAGA